MPDVVLLHPGRRTVFVEVKRSGEVARPVQAYRHQELGLKGFDVRVVEPADWPLAVADWS
jgi:hypothetical protein